MKKILALVLSLVMLLSVGAVFAEEAAAPETYELNVDTFTLTQGPIWFFMYADSLADEIFELHATPEWGDNWQYSAQPSVDQVFHSICEWDGVQAMPGTVYNEDAEMANIDIVVLFVAPKAGSIVINPSEYIVKDDGGEHANYLIKIITTDAEGNEVCLSNADGEWMETPYINEAIELEVAEGQLIAFIVRSGDDGGAAVFCQPSISYK